MKKDWYKSKTIWAALFTAVYVVVTEAFGVSLPDWIEPALLAAGLLFARTSSKPLK
jgi:hypothetical protein